MIYALQKIPYQGESATGSFFTFFYINRRTYWFRKNFLFGVFDGFTLLGCLEHDLSISEKCLSVYLCERQKFCGECSSRTNPQNFMKFYILCFPNINCGLSNFNENLSRSGAVVTLFPKFLK